MMTLEPSALSSLRGRCNVLEPISLRSMVPSDQKDDLHLHNGRDGEWVRHGRESVGEGEERDS